MFIAAHFEVVFPEGIMLFDTDVI